MLWLFVPADRPERFARAMGSGADLAILDLEDGVREDAKTRARDAVAGAEGRFAVRVNPAGSAHWEADLAAAARAAVVIVPKAEELDALAQAHAATGAEIVPQVETARGLARIDALLAAPGVRRAGFGHLDFALDIGAEPSWDALAAARQTLVWRSRAAGAAAPIDSVTAEIDAQATRADAARAAAWGFGGKLLIHPGQVAPAREGLAPAPERAIWARRVLEAAEAAPHGAATLDGRMIDAPVVDAARRILSTAATR